MAGVSDLGGPKVTAEVNDSGGSKGTSNINTVQNLNFHSVKIDVVKFDGVINFWMWRCEVRDALLVQGLKDVIASETKLAEITENDWVRINEVACALICSCLTQDIKYHIMNETYAKKIWDTLSENC